MKSLADLLRDSAKKFYWRRCLVSDKRTLSFRALNRLSDELAVGLKEKLKIQQGDKVAVLLNNSSEFVVALFAVFKLGAVCIPLNVFLNFEELKYILKDSCAKVLISSSEFLKVLSEIRQKAKEQIPALKDIILADKQDDAFCFWQEFFVKNKVNILPDKINPHDLALLIYTSGTTGVPKGVMLSHANLYSNVEASGQCLNIKSSERFLLVLPMFHSFTLTVCILVPIYSGAKIIIVKSLRPFQKVLRTIFLNRITVIVGIPHLYDILKNLNLPFILQMFLRVKVCISGAAPLNVNTLNIFQKKFKRISLLEGYGLTEASPVVSLNPLYGIRKEGSIGLPLPGIEVKVVRDDESETDCDEVGELIVKGPNVMQGYLHHQEETKQTIRGNWLFTGDMAKIDKDGYIFIVGRKKEMIISKGMNIYPLEIENVLALHPKVTESAVVGKQDKSKGEIPVAFIVLKENFRADTSEIIKYCRSRLANYKIPRMIEFRESLPKTPTGKILKRELVVQAKGGRENEE